MSVFSDFRSSIMILMFGAAACGGPAELGTAPTASDSSALDSFDVDIEERGKSLYTRVDAAGTVDFARRTAGGWREGRVLAVDAAGSPQVVLTQEKAKEISSLLNDMLDRFPERLEANLAAPGQRSGDADALKGAGSDDDEVFFVAPSRSAEPHRDPEAEPHQPEPEAEPHQPGPRAEPHQPVVDPVPSPEAEPHKPTAEPH